MATFIALQCFHCSTMQVKQQKKSSNKWSCVVCNQKQSVRKVFAHSLTAKDVRCFVQNFNMSRQLSDHHIISEELHTFDLKPANNKRTDWTEYIDIDDDGGVDHTELTQNLTQAVVTTEMPKAVFKKPKLRHNSSNKHEKLLKPLFPSRSKVDKRQEKDQSKDDPPSKNEIEETSSEGAVETNVYRASKWDSFRAQIQDRGKAFVQQPSKALKGSVYNAQYDNGAPRSTKGPVSKWNSFITEEEDDDYDLQRGTWNCVGEDKNVFDPILNDQRVEDDIHPDFL